MLRFTVNTAQQSFGAILSVDGLNSVTVHFPSQVSDPGNLDQTGLVKLQNAYRLDNAPDKKVFYFFTSDQAIAIKDLRENLGRYQNLSLNELRSLSEFSLYQISKFLLLKGHK